MMPTLRGFRALAVVVLAGTAGCAGRGVTVGPGLAQATSSAGGRAESALGPIVSLRAGVGEGIGFATSLDLQPFRVRNPARDEAHRILYLMPMLSLGNGEVFVLGGLGLGVFHFTGADCVCGPDAGPAVGASLGLASLDVRGTPVSVEVLWREAVTGDSELNGRILGIQVGWPISGG